MVTKSFKQRLVLDKLYSIDEFWDFWELTFIRRVAESTWRFKSC